MQERWMPVEGKRLGGRYEIMHRIGGGGMATVYLAVDQTLERRVAVKVMNDSLSHDQDFIRRFLREAKAAGSLSHPNVVNVYDVGRENDIHYIVMELVKGSSLMEIIETRSYIPVNEAARIAIQMLEGLGHAHENGIVHRDVKPHNIMATHDGRYKVTDFGVSRLSRASTITQTGYVMGSVHYFSPEQARGAETSRSSDLYSVGVVLYEMVTGTLPFDGDEAIAIALKHLQEPVPDPRAIRPDIPESLCRIIFRAMEKEPQNRYQSAQEMIADINSFLNGQPVEAYPASQGGGLEPEETSIDPAEERKRETSSGYSDSLRKTRFSEKRKRRGKKRWALLIGALLAMAFLYLTVVGVSSLMDFFDSDETQHASGNSDTEEEEEDVGDYNWEQDIPEAYEQNNTFRNISFTGEGGNYRVSLDTNARPRFFYDVIVVDGNGKRTVEEKQTEWTNVSGDYSEEEFEVSLSDDEIPKEGLVKIAIYTDDSNRIEHHLETFGQ